MNSTTETHTTVSKKATASCTSFSWPSSYTVNWPKSAGRSVPNASLILSMADEGISSTWTSGMSTVRPNSSGDADVMLASTLLIAGTRLRVTVSSPAWTASASPRSTFTAAACASSLMPTHSVANASLATTLSTWSPTNPSTALDSGTARI